MYRPVLKNLPVLKNHPWVDLFSDATSLTRLLNISNNLGITIDVKRDDTLPLATGGNKIRQLEYYFGQAQQAKADTILISGSIQSNYVRMCAAAARQQGWHPILQLENRVPKKDLLYRTSGNVLISQLFGAELVYSPREMSQEAADASLDRLAEEQRAKGRTPYVIHIGTEHVPYGGLGYVAAAAEVWEQYKTQDSLPQHVFIGTGSGLTQAGFLVGAKAVGWDVNIHGICVSRDVKNQHARVIQHANEINTMLNNIVQITANDVKVYDDILAPGFGQMNDQVAEAMIMCGQKEGLLVDPVYTGRAFAGLLARLRDGTINSGDHVLFLHTGGIAGIFAYQNDLLGTVYN